MSPASASPMRVRSRSLDRCLGDELIGSPAPSALLARDLSRQFPAALARRSPASGPRPPGRDDQVREVGEGSPLVVDRRRQRSDVGMEAAGPLVPTETERWRVERARCDRAVEDGVVEWGHGRGSVSGGGHEPACIERPRWRGRLPVRRADRAAGRRDAETHCRF